MNEECRGLRADLHQRVSLVAQRDEVIRQLRYQVSAQWASGWLAFQQKAVHTYSNLDFNFDLPSDEEAEESFSTNYSQEPGTPAMAHSPSSSSVPPAGTPVLISGCLMSTSFIFFVYFVDLLFVGPGPEICVAFLLVNTYFLSFLSSAFTLYRFPP